MEEFKHSASVQAIHRITGLSVEQSYWACYAFNFLVIAALIIWAGRKFLPGIFRDRTAAIQKAMQEAQKASEEARRRLAEIESRLQRLDVEIGRMRDAAEKEGEAEEARIKAAAEEDAQKIVAMAEQEIVASRQGGAPPADGPCRRSCSWPCPETDSRRSRHRSGSWCEISPASWRRPPRVRERTETRWLPSPAPTPALSPT